MVKRREVLYADPNEMAEIARRQFPTTAPASLEATLDHSVEDLM